MNEEKDISIRIRQTGKKSSGTRFTDFFTERSLTEDPDCIFKQESTVERFLKKNPIIERLEHEDEPEDEETEDGSDETLTSSTTLKPLFTDVTGVLEHRGEVKIRRYDRKNEVIWVVQIDRGRAKFLDRVFADFIAFLKRAFNAE